ncbi:hypothetical protein [Halorubrum sp. Boch-26]|uniref:hypothetical protein n=1 Tax=Halorubrum sp. Boch-26 TaxID=2994426 RepID=UPI00246876E6|nr:hypothetical protein [Halorubrum sp. Boch-26]
MSKPSWDDVVGIPDGLEDGTAEVLSDDATAEVLSDDATAEVWKSGDGRYRNPVRKE